MRIWISSVHSAVGREMGPWKTVLCGLSPEIAWCQKKSRYDIYKAGCLLSSTGAHLGKQVNNIQICLL